MSWYKKLCLEGSEKRGSSFFLRSKKSSIIQDDLLTASINSPSQAAVETKMSISLSQQQLDNIHLVLEAGESSIKSGKHQQHAPGGSTDKVNQINQVCKTSVKQLIDNDLYQSHSSITGSSKAEIAETHEFVKCELQKVPSILSLGSYEEDKYGLYTSSELEGCFPGGIYHTPFCADIQQGVSPIVIEVMGEVANKMSVFSNRIKAKRYKVPKKSALATWKDKPINISSQESDNSLVGKLFGLSDYGNVVIHGLEEIQIITGSEVVVKGGFKKYFLWRFLKACEMKQNTKLKTASGTIKRILKCLRAVFKGNIFHNHLHKTLLLNHP